MSEENASGISVLMPVHNGGAYLKSAVESILSQTHSLLELVIVDDHSTDNAISALPSDSRVRCFKSPERGIVPALNHGIQKARFPYIARMDADDIAVPNRLEAQLNFLIQHPDIAICGTKVNIFKDQESVAGGYQHYEKWINKQCDPDQIEMNFFVESCIPHPSAMMHRRVLEALDGYRDTSWPEDYDLWCRAHLAGLRFGKPNDQVLMHWRDHESRASRNQSRYDKQQFLQCKAFYLSRWLARNNLRECVVWGTGPTGAKMHDYLEENGIEVSGFVDINPRMKGAEKRDKPVHVVSLKPSPEELSAVTPIGVIAVSARGARDKIRAALIAAGMIELRDFIFAA